MNWSGFHRLSHAERLEKVQAHAGLSEADVAALRAPSALPDDATQAFIENAVGSMPVPLGFAVGFHIDGEDIVVPMAVEESSVIAAASHGAKLAGKFTTRADAPVTIGQIEVRNPTNHDISAHKEAWIAAGNELIPSMVARGGGVVDIVARELPGRVVVHVHVDCRDAMGANVVNTIVESLGPDVAAALGGHLGLQILSNLADQRLAEASFSMPVDKLGEDVCQAIVAANDFALVDPYRAATHNKGIMNGIDPVGLATGNDWRAIEAGAHAYAAADGHYKALTRYEIKDGQLVGSLKLPISVGTVGGVTSLHPTAAACLRVLGSPGAQQLARTMAAVGLAQNLSALKALATEGIQKGHMALHKANEALRKGP